MEIKNRGAAFYTAFFKTKKLNKMKIICNCTTNPKQTIEAVALILLLNEIPFNYDNGYLKVTDQIVRHDLFEVACYHSDTKKLVLQCSDYTKAISFNEFLKYFGK